MSKRLVLAPTGHPNVPEDMVTLTVELDDQSCSVPIGTAVEERLVELETQGLTVPISRIVAYAGIHYREEATDYWNIGNDRASIQSAWQDICNWNPQARPDPTGKSRLIFDPKKNSRRQANFTEVIAIGVGLVAAAKVYDTPYRYWRPTPGLAPYDFRAPTTGGAELQLEARGRFEGNWGNAKQQVRDKFGTNPNMARQLGAIFAPRTTVDTSYPDLILVDPEKDGVPLQLGHQRHRALLEHYALFFLRQNFTDFGERLRALAQLSDADFETYLKSGDDTLRKSRIKRISFHIDKYTFVGTAFEGIAWPTHIAPSIPDVDFSTGCFYWGVWLEVVDALREGLVEDLHDMVTEEGMRLDGKKIYIILDDATALAWAPTLDELLAMP